MNADDILAALEQFQAENFDSRIEVVPSEDLERVDLFVFVIKDQCQMLGRLIEKGPSLDALGLPNIERFLTQLEDARRVLAAGPKRMEKDLDQICERQGETIQAILDKLAKAKNSGDS